jgi:hypothetical protein
MYFRQLWHIKPFIFPLQLTIIILLEGELFLQNLTLVDWKHGSSGRMLA